MACRVWIWRESVFPCNLPASLRIAKWAYEQTEQAGGQVWVMKDVLKHLVPEWRLVLGVSA